MLRSRTNAEGAPGALALPGGFPLGARTSVPPIRVVPGPTAGALALASLVAAILLLVLFTAAGPSLLVSRSTSEYPGWEAGPLHGLLGTAPPHPGVLAVALSLLVLVMLAAYAVALTSVPLLSLRAVLLAVLVLHLLLLLGPPVLSSDLFNYLGYARLGGLHALNPYQHVIGQEMHDPVYTFTSWRHLHSPYGPLFTAGSYLLAGLPLPVAYWLLKLATVAASLGVLGLVWTCARRLGRDPRLAVALVALNPIYLVYAVGGFHNDFFMLLPALGAIALLLSRRDGTAGAVLMLAVAFKLSAILLLPFMVLGVGSWARRRRLLAGTAAGAFILIAFTLALFGARLPNLSDQTTLVTGLSIPNLLGWAVGAGGATPAVLRLVNLALLAVVVWLLVRPGDWLARAGWATLALVLSLGWLMPWYVIWVAPLAALARSRRLRHATLGLTLFLVLTALPETSRLMHKAHVRPLSGAAGKASVALERRLAQ